MTNHDNLLCIYLREINRYPLLSREEETGLVAVSQSPVEHIREMLETLPPKEADILALRYGLNGEKCLSLREISRRYRLSRERIRQIEKKAIKKLRAPSYRQVLEADVA